MIAEKQIPVFQQYYGTPRERMYLLPPGIARDRRAPPNAAECFRIDAKRKVARDRTVTLDGVAYEVDAALIDFMARRKAAMPDQWY